MADKRILSQINVTPFVDVMLVLLIIFMVTAPMLESGIDVNLPKAAASPIETAREPVVVTVDKNGEVFISEKAVGHPELKEKLKAIFAGRTSRAVYLRADTSTPYGFVAKTMAEIRNAGVERIAMITEPLPAAKDR